MEASSTPTRRSRLGLSSESSAYVMPGMLERRSSPYDYERVRSPAHVEISRSRASKLGGKSRSKVSGLQGMFVSPSSFFAKLWASCGRLRNTAKETNVNVYDLFVGNQMLCHVTASPIQRSTSCRLMVTSVGGAPRTIAGAGSKSIGPRVANSTPVLKTYSLRR